MKRKDIILGAIVIMAAFLFWFIPKCFLQNDGVMLRVSINGETYGEYPLDTDQEIDVGTTNVCRIQNGVVKMTEAECPDHLCLRQKAIDSSGGTIVCLPNKVILEIMDGKEAKLDSIAQ